MPVQPTRDGEQEFNITPFNLTPLTTFNPIPYWRGIATLLALLILLLIFIADFFQCLVKRLLLIRWLFTS